MDKEQKVRARKITVRERKIIIRKLMVGTSIRWIRVRRLSLRILRC
jgi:hypothetical protein